MFRYQGSLAPCDICQNPSIPEQHKQLEAQHCHPLSTQSLPANAMDNTCTRP